MKRKIIGGVLATLVSFGVVLTTAGAASAAPPPPPPGVLYGSGSVSLDEFVSAYR